ncbi:MAG: beta family protein [Gemmatimonadaceae bacterium]|nr:beta family protein [Gemmatimonadaceae bacterium]
MDLIERFPYRPVLRWKGAEKWALETLPADVRDTVHPIIELRPTSKWRSAAATRNVAAFESLVLAINSAVRGPFTLDLGLTAPYSSLDPHAVWGMILGVVRRENIPLVPTICMRPSPSHVDGIKRVADAVQTGVCLRLKPLDVFSRPFLEELPKLLGTLGMNKNSVDLVVDLEIFDSSQPPLQALMEAFPSLESWRTVTVLRGAFPDSLQDSPIGTSTIKRADFVSWRTAFATQIGVSLMFGDYAVQGGIYRPISGPINRMAANIRYAIPEKWLICKGEDVFDESGPGFRQWPALAQLLVERKEFSGSSFSAGDEFIAQHSLAFEPTGDAKGWIGAGLSHHLVLTGRQVASVAGASRLLATKTGRV